MYCYLSDGRSIGEENESSFQKTIFYILVRFTKRTNVRIIFVRSDNYGND